MYFRASLIAIGVFWCASDAAALEDAALHQVGSAQFTRAAATPVAQSFVFTLERTGELRVGLPTNIKGTLRSSEIRIDGTLLTLPSSLENGVELTFPVAAGHHAATVVMRGAPGGQIRLRALEWRSTPATEGKGWQLLPDGTVLHRNTGLVWHRVAKSPGLGNEEGDGAGLLALASVKAYYGLPNMSAEEYVDALNAGAFGSDSIHGNAGHSDWRLPTPNELLSAIDMRVAAPAISDKNGEVTFFPYPRNGVGGGMRFGDPLHICVDAYPYYATEFGLDECPRYADVMAAPILTNQRNVWDYWPEGNYSIGVNLLMGDSWVYTQRGFVWPVRGGAH